MHDAQSFDSHRSARTLTLRALSLLSLFSHICAPACSRAVNTLWARTARSTRIIGRSDEGVEHSRANK
eukprot:12111079-Alexandrium_andersonii.AAC.1